MTYRFELLPEAMLDVEEAFLWYNAVSSQSVTAFRHIDYFFKRNSFKYPGMTFTKPESQV